MLVNEPIDECAKALAEFFKEKNAKTQREAQQKFALVDWVETEVDPDTIEGHYTECLFQAGTAAGFRTYEQLSDREEYLLFPREEPEQLFKPCTLKRPHGWRKWWSRHDQKMYTCKGNMSAQGSH